MTTHDHFQNQDHMTGEGCKGGNRIQTKEDRIKKSVIEM